MQTTIIAFIWIHRCWSANNTSILSTSKKHYPNNDQRANEREKKYKCCVLFTLPGEHVCELLKWWKSPHRAPICRHWYDVIHVWIECNYLYVFWFIDEHILCFRCGKHEGSLNEIIYLVFAILSSDVLYLYLPLELGLRVNDNDWDLGE